MVYEQRAPLDYYFGTLSSAAAISDTTIASSVFAGLASAVYTTGFYLPLVLHDPAAGVREVVWVTAHTGTSTSVTVVRGREGTTAVAWPAGTQVVCAPTAARDGLGVSTRAALPTDGHTGLRELVSNEGLIVTRTALGGWQPDVGVANPGDFGNRLDTTAIPASAALVMRGDRASGTTDSSGRIVATFKVAFPNQCLCAVATWISGTGNYVPAVYTHSASTLTLFFYKPSDGTVASAGLGVTFSYIAVGY